MINQINVTFIVLGVANLKEAGEEHIHFLHLFSFLHIIMKWFWLFSKKNLFLY